MNPFLALASLRIGFFVLPLGVLALFDVPTPLALATAALASIVLSTVFLRNQRRRVAERLLSRRDPRPPPYPPRPTRR